MLAWPLALATLPAGFAVAELTGSRPAGGAALVVGGLVTVAAARDASLPRRAAWGAVAFGAFVASHSLAGALGAWGSVAAVAAVTGAAGWVLLDR